MKIKFEKVDCGATYQGKTYDFWINGKTESGLKVVLYVDGFDLREYEGKVVDCLILAFMAQDINSIDENETHDLHHPIIKGKYLGSYKIPDEWLKCEKDLLLEAYYGIQTQEGIYLIELIDIEGLSIKKGEDIIFTVGRLDLLAWLPIEE